MFLFRLTERKRCLCGLWIRAAVWMLILILGVAAAAAVRSYVCSLEAERKAGQPESEEDERFIQAVLVVPEEAEEIDRTAETDAVDDQKKR